MQALKEQLAARFRLDPDICSVSAVENPNQLPSLTDGFDLLLLIVTRSLDRSDYIHHYSREGVHIQEKWVHPDQLEQWIMGDSRNLIQWLLKGEILLDRDTYLEALRHKVLEFPFELRGHKLMVEFSRFLRTYLQSKEYLLDEHLLDAYNNILEALQHWARIVIIEEGHHPEITVWRQIRSLNPGVYKLYEELTTSRETVKQRVQLVLLACEFSVMSKMERCCVPLLHILESREEPWSAAELQRLPALRDISADLPLLLNKLVKKSLIREVAMTNDVELELELRYTL
ncbi:nucleotidyltransferase-like protein [Paenibacillus chartarius]|uniref:Nucleotidyltransferase-like protein n=1 Tax=Paenibacillus chartarius TaxID=747481 RepID=A0ABV6DLQ4_9BACL